MTKYLLLYRAPGSASDQMASATPEQAQAGMDAWMGWAGRAGSALTDMGAPCQYSATVGATYPSSEGFIGGYSIVEADSLDAAKALLDGHPHLMMGEGAGIDVHELLEMPGT
jgi:YCII-related domain